MSVVAGCTAAVTPCSTWHSPAPNLFGGLLGLVGFALLILACSYCRHYVRLANAGEDAERDAESGGNDGGSKKKMEVYEDNNILVIMAGEKMPTFLATPASTKASTLGGFNGGEGSEKAESGDKPIP